jgi:thiol:disulfide interchange protein DsbD
MSFTAFFNRTFAALALAGGIAALSGPAFAAFGNQEFLDPKVAFQPSAQAIDSTTIEVSFKIAKGYYLYKEKFKFAADGATLGTPILPAGKLKKDENFGDVEVYFSSAVIRVPLAAGAAMPQSLNVTSMGCADGGICYPPQTALVEVKAATAVPGTAGPAGSAAAGAATTGDESARIAGLFKDASFAWILASFFGFGLLLALTPCVLPMLPILSGIIVGHGHKVSRGRAFVLSLAYVLGMAVTYAAAGVAAGLSGTLVSAAFQNAWVLSSFALVFVILSFSMFGFYELQLPTFLQSKLSEEANHQKAGNLYGVATMGAISALIVGPCVAAPLAGALLYIGQTGDAVLGGTALFVLALGMGVPLIAAGVSAGHLMPRVGPWMEAVKRAFGVILLGTAVWFVSPVIPVWAQMLAWAVLLIVPAVYMHALDSLPAHANGWHRLWKGVGILMLLYGGALIVGVLAGSRDPLQPLQFLAARSASGKAVAAEATHTAYVKVATVAELEAKVKAAGKPVMLDFYADWCISCKEMERFTMSDPEVRRRLERFLLVQADVTQNTPDDQALLKRFKLYGPPGIIFFDARGQELATPRVVGFQDVPTFSRNLDAALDLQRNSPTDGRTT